MFKNYLKIAFRNLKRQKMHSLINISGLAVGLAVFILAALYSTFHFGFDTFHKDYQRIYTLNRLTPSVSGEALHNVWTPAPVLPLMVREFPEIEAATRWIIADNRVIRRGDNSFPENRVWVGDPNFFSVFSFEMKAGNRDTALSKPDSVVITESTALKYFGTDDPIGQALEMSRDNTKRAVTVTGVIADTPDSSIRFDFLLSASETGALSDWDRYGVTFLRLKQGIDPAQLEAKFPAFIEQHVPLSRDLHERMYLFPFRDIHLKSLHIPGSFYGTTTGVQFYLVLVLAVVLLLVVCINFMNLATARYMNRSKEVGLRKVVGASRNQLIKQFLGESVFLSFVSLPVGITLYEIIRPGFNAVVGSEMELSLWQSPLLLLGVLGITLLTGIIAGSYPAFFLSSFKPVHSLKKDLRTGVKGARMRQILVVGQFTMTVIAIVLTFTVIRQLDHLGEADLGFNRENVGVIPLSGDINGNIEPLKNELLKHPGVIAAATAPQPPMNWGDEARVQVDGASLEEALTMGCYEVGYDYIELLGIQIVKGRSFSRLYNDADNFVISEMTAAQLGWDDPVGKPLIMNGRKGTVIGVVRDYHFRHVFFSRKPAVMYLGPDHMNFLFVKSASPPDAAMLGYIEQQWERFAPGMPYRYQQLEHRFQDVLRETTRSTMLFKYISVLAVFISCLGLFGLASHTVEKKTKEIGIRKTLGASSGSIVGMFIIGFVKLVLLANVIALPFAYYASNWFIQWAWVSKIKVGVLVFILAAVLSLLSAILSVIFQTLKAARSNPIESLRYE